MGGMRDDDVLYAHNTERTADGKGAVISWDRPDEDDLHNWHVATDAEYASYEEYWTGPCSTGQHERGECHETVGHEEAT